PTAANLISRRPFNGMLYFTGRGGRGQGELWRSDGTEAGTVLVKAIGPDEPTAFNGLSWLTNANGTLCFAAYTEGEGQELWKSDGTDAGTVLVKDINPSGNSTPNELTALDGVLYFTAIGSGGGGLPAPARGGLGGGGAAAHAPRLAVPPQ